MFGIFVNMDLDTYVKGITGKSMFKSLSDEQRTFLKLVLWNKTAQLKTFLNVYKLSHAGKSFKCDFFINSKFIKPIELAAKYNQVEVCELLLENGAAPIRIKSENKELKALFDKAHAKSPNLLLRQLLFVSLCSFGLMGLKLAYPKSYSDSQPKQQHVEKTMTSPVIQKNIHEFQQREKQNTK